MASRSAPANGTNLVEQPQQIQEVEIDSVWQLGNVNRVSNKNRSEVNQVSTRNRFEYLKVELDPNRMCITEDDTEWPKYTNKPVNYKSGPK